MSSFSRQWSKDTASDGKIQMLADGNADFAKKLGLDIDLTQFGLGVRSKRYSMLVDDGVGENSECRGRAASARQMRAPRRCARMIDRSI